MTSKKVSDENSKIDQESTSSLSDTMREFRAEKGQKDRTSLDLSKINKEDLLKIIAQSNPELIQQAYQQIAKPDEINEASEQLKEKIAEAVEPDENLQYDTDNKSDVNN